MNKKVLGFIKRITTRILINRFTRDKSIKTKLIIYFLILTIVPLSILGIASYNKTKQTIEQKTNQYVKQLLEQVDINLNYYLKDAVYISALLSTNQNLTYLIKNYDSQSEVEKLKSDNEISRILSDLMNTKREIYSIVFFKDDQIFSTSTFSNIKKVTNEKYFKDIESGSKDTAFIGKFTLQFNLNIKQETKKQVLSVFRNVKDMKTGEKLGVVMVNIDYKVIKDIIKSIDVGPKSSLFLLSEYSDVIYKSGQDIPVNGLKDLFNAKSIGKSGSYIMNGEGKNIVFFKTSPYSGWKIAAVVPYGNLIKDAVEIRYLIILVALVCLIFGIIVSLVLASHVTNPIKTLVLLMRKVENGDLSGQIEVKSSDEIGQLTASYNLMQSRLRDLIDKIYDEQKKKRIAEIRVLEMQINPHFLYNTLDSIKWVAILQKANNAAEMITYLVRLLKISLNKGKEYITIEEEIEHVKCYVEIQKFRYNDKFDIEFEIDESLMACKIPKLILQPIIENSIFHGFREMVLGGKINIKCWSEDRDIRFSIIDNGCGVEVNKVEGLLNQGIQVNKGERLSGIGLNNVNDRIKLIYGEKYGLNIKNPDTGGARVDVLLPQLFEMTGGSVS